MMDEAAPLPEEESLLCKLHDAVHTHTYTAMLYLHACAHVRATTSTHVHVTRTHHTCAYSCTTLALCISLYRHMQVGLASWLAPMHVQVLVGKLVGGMYICI